MAERIAYEMVRGSTLIEVPVFVLLQVVVAALTVSQGEAIQCFVCNSKSDPRCADPIQTDWESSEESDSEEDSDDDGGLAPVECHLAVKYSAGIQAVSDLLRGFGQPRLGVPDLWLSTAMALSPSSGTSSSYGSTSGGNSGGYGNRGYGNRGYGNGNRGSVSWGHSYGQRERDDGMGCHKVDYTENGESVVDRGCAPSRVANMDPCSALELSTSGGGGDSNNVGNSVGGGSSGFGAGSPNTGGSGFTGGTFDLSQISADFCEICSDGDGCNAATYFSSSLQLVFISFFIFVLRNGWI